MKCLQTCGWLNLLANMIDNFTHGLAVAGSFSVGIKVSTLSITFVFWIKCNVTVVNILLHLQIILTTTSSLHIILEVVEEVCVFYYKWCCRNALIAID